MLQVEEYLTNNTAGRVPPQYTILQKYASTNKYTAGQENDTKNKGETASFASAQS
jgi:hypothetical protein